MFFLYKCESELLLSRLILLKINPHKTKQNDDYYDDDDDDDDNVC